VLVEQPFHTVIFVCNGEATTVNQREQQHHHEASAEGRKKEGDSRKRKQGRPGVEKWRKHKETQREGKRFKNTQKAKNREREE